MDAGPSFVLPDPPVVPAAIAHLVVSNSVPNGLEKRITRAYIAELEKQAAFLKNVMAVCARQHAELLKSLATHEHILSPIRRLPNKLLAEIFMVVVRDAFLRGHSGPASRYPRILRMVCKRWNAVTLSTQSLWSWLYLDLDLTQSGSRAAARMNLFHERSGNSLLTIKIVETDGSKRHDALDVALAQCERWQNVILHATRRSPLPHDIVSLRGRLPALTTRGFPYRPPFEFPWGQLTRLSIALRSREEAPPLFSQLSSIVELKVECADRSDEEPVFPRNLITLHHLRMLDIRSRRSRCHDLVLSESPSLLDCLNAPLLEHLAVDNEAHENQVLGFIARCACQESLKSFHFMRQSTSQETVLSLARAMPHLLDLQIGNLEDDPEDPTVPASFKRALFSHWRAVRSKTGASALSVCLVHNTFLSREDVYPLMEKDGLSISISSYTQIESLVDSKFF
ncbi:hypothetical protein FB45DRAFT_1051207 [Roridomyces roridus]|uniref:F-box domain-containing protein n=1 Tax=Roridomyces roridus TaxID=1738132 RepID=A0AAD7FZP3_9AGAR|nr:hypothetical protein FB45DRAFT_1051207 [Roridomyces roridus]